ncbi:MAG: hypothetical protein ACI9VN_002466, partial [Patescibacteria group bacterium]
QSEIMQVLAKRILLYQVVDFLKSNLMQVCWIFKKVDEIESVHSAG